MCWRLWASDGATGEVLAARLPQRPSLPLDAVSEAVLSVPPPGQAQARPLPQPGQRRHEPPDDPEVAVVSLAAAADAHGCRRLERAGDLFGDGLATDDDVLCDAVPERDGVGGPTGGCATPMQHVREISVPPMPTVAQLGMRLASMRPAPGLAAEHAADRVKRLAADIGRCRPAAVCPLSDVAPGSHVAGPFFQSCAFFVDRTHGGRLRQRLLSEVHRGVARRRPAVGSEEFRPETEYRPNLFGPSIGCGICMHRHARSSVAPGAQAVPPCVKSIVRRVRQGSIYHALVN